MSGLNFIDTNILLYSISRDPSEEPKRKRSQELLDQRECALSVQVLQEFYVQSTRESRAERISHDLACGFIAAWMRFKVQELTLRVLADALDIKAKYGFSYWDGAIIAAASALGCSQILTEDLQHGQRVEGIRITNPFL